MQQIKLVLLFLCVIIFSACGEVAPEPAKLNADNCEHCKMTIADPKFVAEFINSKGRIYKFDDVYCLIEFNKQKGEEAGARLYVADYVNNNTFIEVANANYCRGGNIKSPMGGNVAAFADKTAAQDFATKTQSEIVSWSEVNK